MGSVYKGRHDLLDREVALKFLAPHLASDPMYVDRFQREAHAAALLHHPHIITIHDAGVHKDLFYLAMEFVEGQSLFQMLKTRKTFDEQDVLKIGLLAAKALDHAHQSGIIHRDIKPDNIMLSKSGELKIADLGLAKLTSEEGTNITVTGATLGTPHYISPEQILGKKDIDRRTDIYSLGATLFHLITGNPPFFGGTAGEVMSKQISGPPPMPHVAGKKISDEFCRLYFKMVAIDRDDRFPDMSSVSAAIEKALKSVDSTEEPGSSLNIDMDQLAKSSSDTVEEKPKLKLKTKEPSRSSSSSTSNPSFLSPAMQADPSKISTSTESVPVPPRKEGFLQNIEDYCRGKNWMIHGPLVLYCVYVAIRQLVEPTSQTIFLWFSIGIHQWGHWMFQLGGDLLAISGGTILQILFPMVLLGIAIYRKKYFSFAYYLSWFGTCLLSVGTYMTDARFQGLATLISGDGPKEVHDWQFLAGKMGFLMSSSYIGTAIQITAHSITLLGLAAGGWLLWKTYSKKKTTSL